MIKEVDNGEQGNDNHEKGNEEKTTSSNSRNKEK